MLHSLQQNGLQTGETNIISRLALNYATQHIKERSNTTVYR
jgi:hypothetical protein